MGKLGVSSGLEFAILVAREADAEQAANLKRVDDSAPGPKQSTAGTCCFKCNDGSAGPSCGSPVDQLGGGRANRGLMVIGGIDSSCRAGVSVV